MTKILPTVGRMGFTPSRLAGDRFFVHIACRQPLAAIVSRLLIFEFSILMLTLMFGKFVRPHFWTLIYLALGAFEDFEPT